MRPYQATRRQFLESLIVPIGALPFIWPTNAAAQRQVVGRIIARNGYPQANCDVAFYIARKDFKFRIRTNNDGYFSLTNPVFGTYSVLVQNQWFDVTIDGGGMRPSTIVVG
jgi:hypothetical protein